MAIQAGETTFYQAKRGIVQDGLVLNLDAAVDASYSGGTTWRDLAGGNNGTLTNMNSANLIKNRGNVLLFDGTDEHIVLQDPMTAGDAYMSFSIWFKPDQIIHNAGLINIKSNPRNLCVFLRTASPTNGVTVNMLQGGGISTANSSVVADSWYNIIGVADNGQQTIYLNGSSVASSSTGTSWGSSGSTRFLGRSESNIYYDGSIASFQIYNRALTAAEVLQNYNATRHRFGV